MFNKIMGKINFLQIHCFCFPYNIDITKYEKKVS